MEMYPEINHAIQFIQDNLHEDLTLEQIARHVSYSPYHFSRIFKQKIGLPPHYFLSSMRIQKAKELLIHTHLSIRDIGLEIGQQSLGTFTTRFTEKVGISPSAFRNTALVTKDHLKKIHQLSAYQQQKIAAFTSNQIVKGTIEATPSFRGVILVGLFAKPIPEGLPLYGTILNQAGPFLFNSVKPGKYYLLTTSISMEMGSTAMLLTEKTLRAKLDQPVIVNGFDPVSPIKLTLRPPKIDDPPILTSVQVLMQRYLTRTLALSNR